MTRLITTVQRLEAWLEPVDVLVDECKIHLNADQARIAAVDPANVAMVESTIDPDGLDAYDVGGETFAVDLDRFMDVLGLGSSGDLVFLSYDHDTHKLHIEVGNHEYTLATIEPNAVREEPDLPDLDLSLRATIEGQDLDAGITAADLCSDHLTIKSSRDEDGVVFEAAGDTDTVETVYDRDDLIDFSFGEANSLFSLDYMTDVVGPIEDDAEVYLRVGAEYPTRLRYFAAEGYVGVTTIVSPRIQGGGL